MPDVQGAVVSSPTRSPCQRHARAESSSRPAGARKRSSEYLSLFARREARAARRRGLDLRICGRARPPARIARGCSPTRASSRSCASPRASCARLHLQLLQNHVETEKDFAQGDRARGRSARRASTFRADSYSAAGAPVFGPRDATCEQLRRYHAVFPPEQVLVLIYDDFRRDNEATVRTVLRFLEVDDTVADRAWSRPTPRSACARRDSNEMRALAQYGGRGPLSRAVKADRQGARRPEDCAPRCGAG